MERAMFGAGCFWGVEAAFQSVAGVIKTAAGFSGGKVKNPTYNNVCTNMTGHAEVVEVQYDPTIVSYEKLLETFWRIHDPTQLNRQGSDYGTQYRSVIFFYNSQQQQAALNSLEKLSQTGNFKSRRVVTEINPVSDFYPAGEYHQKFLEKRGLEPCFI
jgi:peptide-methionine (S)-S-oxide reductase